MVLSMNSNAVRRYISNRHPATLRFGTIAIKHIATERGLPLCGIKRSKELYSIRENDRQFLLCSHCESAARSLRF
jgi:hypothetical protein